MVRGVTAGLVSLALIAFAVDLDAPALAHSLSAGATTGTSGESTEGSAAGPAPAYQCSFNVNTDAFTGADATASAIGWLGDHNSVITCLGGTFVVQDGPGHLFQDDGFGIYDGQRVTWADAGGYLPAQVTTFDDGGAKVSITEFADRVVLGGNPFVAVYSRVRVANPTAHTVTADPEASPSLIPLDAAPDAVPPHHAVDHDYVVVSDRFASAAPWPSAQSIAAAGGFDQHFAHMRAFWNAQLAGIAQISVPDAALVDAYKSGFITTQITRSGDALDTGVNGYESEFSHDVVGILTNLFTQGYFTDAHALLTEARNVVGSQGQYVDGLWTYTVPWAVYLLKTGDTTFVAQNFGSEGPLGPAEPSIEDAAHAIAADRTGPMGTMEETNDIDTQGYWTTDDYEALLGLAAYRYLAAALGNASETTWATAEYNSLLAATNAVLEQTIERNGLDYLPCSLVQPNSANRCDNPRDANWTSPFGFGSWAWEGYLLGATESGPGLTMIDATYAYGFGRLRGVLPPGTTGGFPDDWYSSAYDAANGAAGLASAGHRDQGIVDYEFMIAHSQSGPFSWWESSSAARPELALGRAAPRGGARLVTPCLGHGRRQQGLARLAGGPAGRRRAGRGPWCPAGVVAPGHADHGHQLPHHPWPTGRHHDHLQRQFGLPDRGRVGAGGSRPLPGPLLHRERRVGLVGHRRRGERHGDTPPNRPARAGHLAPRAVTLSTPAVANPTSPPSRSRRSTASQPGSSRTCEIVTLGSWPSRRRSCGTSARSTSPCATAA